MKKEEILKKHIGPPDEGFDINCDFRSIIEAVQEYADQETKSLRQELEEANKAKKMYEGLYVEKEQKISELETEKALLLSVCEDYKKGFAPEHDSLKDEVQSLSARLGELEEKTKEFVKAHEQWEADVINEDKLWWPNKAQDVLRGPIYDGFLKVQEMRNDLNSLLNKQ